MTQYYSRSDTAYSGSATFSIPFSYIKQDDITVKIIRIVEDVETEITATFTWLNASQITITTELQTGDIVSIRRNTPINQKIVIYQNQSMILDEDNLNLSQDQVFNAIQEMRDDNVTFQLDVDEEFEEYKNTVDDEIETIDDKADSAISTANSADSKADSAVSTANSADSKADNAVSTAGNAVTSAQEAAQSASASATSAAQSATNIAAALATAQEAASNASTALNTAQSASTTANSASNKVDEFGETIQTVLDAADEIEELENAVNTAINAAEAANAAVEETMEIIDNLGQVDWDVDDTTAREYIKNKPNLVLTVNNEQPDEYGNVNVQTGGTQVQADWNETDTTSEAYIQNKPANLSEFTDNLGSNPLHTHSQYLTAHQNLKTINGNSIVGTGDLSINGLPSQSGQSGKILKTDGTGASWESLSTLGAITSSDLTEIIALVSETTSGDYRLRTWSNGLKELWCIDYTQTTAGAYNITYPSGTFTADPLLIVDYHLAATASTSTTTRNYGFSRSSTGFSVYLAANAHISFYARGY